MCLFMNINSRSVHLRGPVASPLADSTANELFDMNMGEGSVGIITLHTGCDVVCSSSSDGFSYERESIESWISGKNRTSPMTNLPLLTTLVTPNRSLKMAIARWQSSQ